MQKIRNGRVRLKPFDLILLAVGLYNAFAGSAPVGLLALEWLRRRTR